MKIVSLLDADASLQDFRVNRSTLDARFITPVKNRFTSKAKNIFCLVAKYIEYHHFNSKKGWVMIVFV
jgi:hypothetical protein